MKEVLLKEVSPQAQRSFPAPGRAATAGVSKQAADTNQQKALVRMLLALPKLLQTEYSRPAVTFGCFTCIAQARFILGIIW